MSQVSESEVVIERFIGQPFNPYKVFAGVLIPDPLLRYRHLSPGAKLTYGRLCRYAGKNGLCFPSIRSLAAGIAVGNRQVQKNLSELESRKLIKRVSRFSARGQTSNGFEFLWHPIFEHTEFRSGARVNDSAREGKDSSYKESHREESHVDEGKTELELPSGNRKRGASRCDLASRASVCNQYPDLRERLAEYMMVNTQDEKVYPKDHHVVKIMDAAGGASEAEVIRCLAYLHDERGLKPGTSTGPRYFSWFVTVVGEYFQRKRDREQATGPIAISPPRMSRAEFDRMTQGIEIP